MWFIATHGRPHQIKRLIEYAKQNDCLKNVHVLINDGPHALEYVELLRDHRPMDNGFTWSWDVDGPRKQIPALNDHIWRHINKLEWVGHLCDDVELPEGNQWEADLLAVAMSRGAAFTKDRDQPMRLHGAGIFRADILRKLGWLYPVGLQHMFGDDVWETFMREMRFPVILDQHVSTHMHPINGRTAGDRTHIDAAKTMDADRQAYAAWFGQRNKDYNKIGPLVGHEVRTVDLSKNKIAILTPSKDGNVSMEYLYSMLQMAHFMDKNNIKWQHFNISGNSLLTDARNDLLKLFWEGDFTHALLIDADMGWPADAVGRLLSAQKDIIGVAGPQRKAKLKFAFALLPDGSFNYDTRTGNVEVARVGTAFLLLSRNFVARMIKGYPESYKIEHGTNEPFFDMFYLGRPPHEDGTYSRHSEDYTLCEDWRRMGGKVWMDPSVVLEHKGTLLQRGAAIDVLRPVIDSTLNQPKAAE